MRRVVSLWLPSWPTDRWRRRRGHAAPPPEAPLVLVAPVGRRRVVWAADAAALAAGLRPGMAATQARALVPGLVVHEAEPAADDAALVRLALWAQRLYAPVVAADPPDGLLIDATGAAHLRGGEAALLADLVGRLEGAGLRARAAMAAAPGAAHALARHRARPTLVVEGGGEGAALAAALADLPVVALRLAPALVAALEALGLDRIGDLEAQPRAPLARRLGIEVLRRLDQAQGRLVEPIVPVVAPGLVMAQRDLAEPVGAPEVLARHVALLAADFCAALAARGLGARVMDLVLHRVDADTRGLRAAIARPTRDAAHLARLLGERLERVDPGFGVERLVLSALVAEPLVERPALRALGEAPLPDLAALVDALASRVGRARLYRLAAVPSDVPERSVRRVAPLAAPTSDRWPPQWPRPVRLLARPEPVETLALLPDHPPAWFTWRGVRRRVARADGPERVHGEWWRRDAEVWAVRDYFQVEDEAGGRFWLFRAGDGEDPATGSGRWFLHGVFG